MSVARRHGDGHCLRRRPTGFEVDFCDYAFNIIDLLKIAATNAGPPANSTCRSS